jgi:hypothetical protein
VSIFADRGLYIAVTSDMFIDNESFLYDENTGEVSPNPAHPGVSVVFDLPLNPSLSDAKKAEAYLENLGSQSESDSGADSDERENEIADSYSNIDWDNAEVVEWSKSTLTVDSLGDFTYKWDSDGKQGTDIGGGTITANIADVFIDEKMTSAIVHVMIDDTKTYALRVEKSDDGTFTGMIVLMRK